MDILDIIDALEDLIVQARRLPVGGNLVVDRKRMLDIIDQLRLAVPADIREAAVVLRERDDVIADARAEANRIRADAEREREHRLEQTAVMRDAQERSRVLTIEAESRARQTVETADATAAEHLNEAVEAATRQLDDADEYASEVLRRLETQLTAFLESIHASMASLQERR